MAYNQTIPSFEELRALSLVYLRAIALAWEDSDEGRKFKRLLVNHTEQALEEYFNYTCPFSINLEVRESPPDRHSRWVPTATDQAGKTVPGHWVGLPPNEIDFGLPNKPAPMFDEAIALAAYVDDGPCYLFSCC